MQVKEIPIDEIHDDALFNCRGEISPIEVVNLMRDIDQNGLQNALLVYEYNSVEKARTGKKYKLVSGYRRYKACKTLDWTTVPCNIESHMDDVTARIKNLGENINRQQLSIYQEAKAIEALKLAGLTQEEVATRLHASRGWVQVRFMLLELPKEIQADAAAGMLNQQQIRDLYSLPTHEKQFTAVKQIKEAKARGETLKIKASKPKNLYLKRERNRAEIFKMMEVIQDAIGNNFGTRCLAWAGGEIMDIDLHRDIQGLAKEVGKKYDPPDELLSQVS
jgi:ParB family transcriptional regulator, chromosome partitioning protein